MSLYEHKVLHGCVCVCLIRVHYAGLQSQMQRPGCAKELILHSTTSSSLPRKHSQDHSAHAHSRKSLSLTHTHTYTETITFTHSHRHTFMLMHKHTLMLLLIQAHTCSTQSPSTPAEKSICISSITALMDGPGSRLPSPSLLSLFCFSFLCADTRRQNVYTALPSLWWANSSLWLSYRAWRGKTHT